MSKAAIHTEQTPADRGAAAIMMAVVTIVIAALAAFVVDTGQLYEERRDLQTGSTAAALAIAQGCASGEFTSCGGDGSAAQYAMADQFADLNTNDGASRVTDVSFDGNEVFVTLGTDSGPDRLNIDGDPNTVDHFFARIFGNAGTDVGASASAAWGSPGSVGAIPIAFSSCEWDEATGGVAPTPDTPSDYRIIYLHDLNPNSNDNGNGSTPDQCQFGPGQDVDGDGIRAEGGFGFLDATDCRAEISAGGLVQGSPGNGNPSHLGCDLTDILGQELLIPIFEDITDTGAPCGAPTGQNCYSILGFAAMQIEDVDLTGGAWSNQGNICLPQQSCIGGHFVNYVDLDVGLEILNGTPGPDFGVTVVALSG
jgi:hypothetical protein